MKYHHSDFPSPNPVLRDMRSPPLEVSYHHKSEDLTPYDTNRGQSQMGSLTGAVHLSKDNAGVLRGAQLGQKPSIEQKGKCYP